MSLTKVTYSMIDGPSINVQDFGATGDGVTNDTVSVQAAVAASEGKILVFPEGTYIVDNVLLAPKSNSSWFLTPKAKLKNTPEVTYVFIYCENVVNWNLFGGGTIENSLVSSATENGYALIIESGCQNITIDNITFDGAMADCVIIGTAGTAPTNIHINNVVVTNARRNGLAITSGNNIQITNSTFKNTSHSGYFTIQSGLDIEPNPATFVSNVLVSGCTFTGNDGCGLSVYGFNGTVGSEVISDISIINNTFDDNCKYGASVTSTLKGNLETVLTSRCSIINNKLINLNKRGGIYCDENRDTNVQGNSVVGTGVTGITAGNTQLLSGITVIACEFMSVSENSVKNSNASGYYIFFNQKCLLANNIADIILFNGITSQQNVDCNFEQNLFSNIQNIGIFSLNDNFCDFDYNRVIDNNLAGSVGVVTAGSAILISLSSTNTPTNIKVIGNTIRTPNTIPTFPLRISAGVVDAYAATNDFRGTFVNPVTDSGTGTILTGNLT
jgi:hypothetical protein